MKKLIKYKRKLVLICLIIVIIIFLNLKYTTINTINSNYNLNLPKPKSVDTILPGGYQDDTDFDILYYTEKDIPIIKQQVNNRALDTFIEKKTIMFENATTEERQIIFKQYLDEIEEKYLYFTYFEKGRMGTMIIFDEKTLKLYHLRLCIKWTLNE